LPAANQPSSTSLDNSSKEEEERAFGELNRLAEELKQIDPAAFNGYEGFLWPGVLDRWLY
jgi:hypothetical protein